MLNQFDDIIVSVLRTASGVTDGYIQNMGREIGDKINDLVENTETDADDLAKEKVVLFLEAAITELKVEGVDD